MGHYVKPSFGSVEPRFRIPRFQTRKARTPTENKKDAARVHGFRTGVHGFQIRVHNSNSWNRTFYRFFTKPSLAWLGFALFETRVHSFRFSLHSLRLFRRSPARPDVGLRCLSAFFVKPNQIRLNAPPPPPRFRPPLKFPRASPYIYDK